MIIPHKTTNFVGKKSLLVRRWYRVVAPERLAKSWPEATFALRRDNNKLAGRRRSHAGTGKTVRKCGNLALIESEQWFSWLTILQAPNSFQKLLLKHVIIKAVENYPLITCRCSCMHFNPTATKNRQSAKHHKDIYLDLFNQLLTTKEIGKSSYFT